MTYTFTSERPPTDDPGWLLYERTAGGHFMWGVEVTATNQGALLAEFAWEEGCVPDAGNHVVVNWYEDRPDFVSWDGDPRRLFTLVDPQPVWQTPALSEPYLTTYGELVEGQEWSRGRVGKRQTLRYIDFLDHHSDLPVWAWPMPPATEPELVAVMLPLDVVERSAALIVGAFDPDDLSLADHVGLACRSALADREAGHTGEATS